MKIEDETEIQFRQVNPTWLDQGEPSRLAFIPTKKDNGNLSLDRSATTTAKKACEDFKTLGLRSESVFGLTVGEFSENPTPVECFSSPLENNPHHSHADFNGLSNSEKKRKSIELRRSAIGRGRLYP